MVFSQLVRKDTTFFLYMQARAHIFLKKCVFVQKNAILSTLNFQLSTKICTFVPYFGVLWTF